MESATVKPNQTKPQPNSSILPSGHRISTLCRYICVHTETCYIYASVCVWDRLPTPVILGFPGGSDDKESTCNARPGFDPWVAKAPCHMAWQTTPVFLPRESHGQRSLAGYCAWGCKESDTAEHVYTYIYIYMHTWPPLQHASMTVALDANNQTLHSTEFLRTFWKRVICLVIPTDTIKNSERAQLKNHIQSAINYRGTPCLSGRSFVATLQQIDKDRSDRQRIGKLEQEKRAPPLESDNQWRQHRITPSFAAVEPDLPTSPDLP